MSSVLIATALFAMYTTEGQTSQHPSREIQLTCCERTCPEDEAPNHYVANVDGIGSIPGVCVCNLINSYNMLLGAISTLDTDQDNYEHCMRAEQVIANVVTHTNDEQSCCQSLCHENGHGNFGHVSSPAASNNWMTQNQCQCSQDSAAYNTVPDIQSEFDECETTATTAFADRSTHITDYWKKNQCCKDACKQVYVQPLQQHTKKLKKEQAKKEKSFSEIFTGNHWKWWHLTDNNECYCDNEPSSNQPSKSITEFRSTSYNRSKKNIWNMYVDCTTGTPSPTLPYWDSLGPEAKKRHDKEIGDFEAKDGEILGMGLY